ncbi:MAG: Smr/MutS family protein [Woeseiaceae bacterium]
MSEDESDLFKRAMADAKPLQSEERVSPPSRKLKPRARFARADERAALAESLQADIDDLEMDNVEYLRFSRPGVSKREMRQLSRGRYAVQGEIDLHGMTLEEAHENLHEFVSYSANSGKTCIRVVHGKGLGSGERGPVLKRGVNRWMRRWHEVLAFVSTRQVHGGTGAVYVLLRRS